MFPNKIIETEEEYEAALQRIDEIFDAKPDTPEGNEVQMLFILVKKYEDEHFEKPTLPDPIEAIKERMEDLHLKPQDLVPAIGDKGTVSKILNRKKPLSLRMIRNLSKILNLPAEVLIQEINLEPV